MFKKTNYDAKHLNLITGGTCDVIFYDSDEVEKLLINDIFEQLEEIIYGVVKIRNKSDRNPISKRCIIIYDWSGDEYMFAYCLAKNGNVAFKKEDNIIYIENKIN